MRPLHRNRGRNAVFARPLRRHCWMLELVHQHAPDALLGFCDGVDLDFNGCVQDLGNNFHADIIVDDILFSGQFYPDVTAASIAQLETANDRMVFVHLSGNEQNGGYWQGSYVPTAAIIAGAQTMLLDFGIASGGASDAFNAITLPAANRLRLILNWNDPPHDPANRALTAYLLDANSQVLTQMSSESDPTLLLDYTNWVPPSRCRRALSRRGRTTARFA